jgi:aminoacyl tRNA synthase complex-interacting multifunctional protein 1
MATSSIDEELASLLQKSFPSSNVSAASDPAAASTSLFPSAHYTDAEKKDIAQWTTTSSQLGSSPEQISKLNTHLSNRTTILGTKPSVADIAVYRALAPVVKAWSPDERTGEHGHHHIVRFVDFVQNAELYGGLQGVEKVAIDPDDVRFKPRPADAKAEKEKKKKEAAAAAAAAKPNAPAAEGSKSKKEKAKEKVEQVGEAVAAAVTGKEGGKKKEKKEKAPKPAKEAPKEKPLSPSLIDLRVGHILKAIAHPNADSLYVSTIACGDSPGTDNTSEYEGQVVRTVCSGLNGLIPLEDMQNRKIVAVCNLKPVTMRGIKSAAMVLAASPRLAVGEEDHHKGPVELVNPPADSKAGDRVYFEGWEGEPEPVLNPKKKIWETIQPGFTTTQELVAGFEVGDVPQLAGEGADKKSGLAQLRTKDGVCTVATLKGAAIK